MKRTSMQSKIPPAIREQLAEDPWMKTCCLSGYDIFCKGRITWHHSMTYAGKRVNELYTILPVCEAHHDIQASLREPQKWIMARRIAEFDKRDQFLKEYPRSDLFT